MYRMKEVKGNGCQNHYWNVCCMWPHLSAIANTVPASLFGVTSPENRGSEISNNASATCKDMKIIYETLVTWKWKAHGN